MKIASFAFLLALTSALINHTHHSCEPVQVIEKRGTNIGVKDSSVEVENTTVNFSETTTNWVQSIQTQTFIIY